MISAARRRAHPVHLLAAPSVELTKALVDAGPPLMVTLAPELEGAEPVVRMLAEAGTVVAIGHSDATAAEVSAAVTWGASHVTHLYNAMSGLDHRRPGVAAAALVDERLTVGLIADGIHVAPPMIRLAHRLKGPHRLALVSDAVSALGMGDGTTTLGGVPLTIRRPEVRTADGALAGSAAGLDHGVTTVRAATECDLDEAVAMASVTPAAIVGHRPDPGDAVWIDEDGAVTATAVGGNLVYRRDGP